ncbi:MaoC/PaaZ C-terminal domain-containing protein [Streptomyces sp. LP05-1]|uniref:MaoC/PaaZ C-terminal domain-containing protein n=1 Tax=Streptomyces pyxinae TaxID=2970734 RepID=A0ABT2CPR1_9ACTN|nr:MaoC/PaaZ C-terminal domain-containing protein [Streptomyces sp. LP05-1]MCS0639418.1 MaoC/PaaZ C-terminal domain-containing protein [Streptomyces sp. LP05-1]
MNLPLTLALGALRSPFKRGPYPDAGRDPFPDGDAVPAARSARSGPPGSSRVLRAEVRAEPARLAAYARLCGWSETGCLPLPYPQVLAFPLTTRLLAARDFPLPLLGLVHTWIEVDAHRPLLPADRLETTVRVERLAPHRRGTEAVVATEARVGGELVWASRSGYLARHRTGPAVAGRPGPGAVRDTGGTTPAPGTAPATDPDATPAPAPAPGTDGGEPAKLLPAAEWRLPGDLGRRYGAVSGDRNPIHLYPLTARAFGFRRPIAHGMWTFARCLAERDLPRGVRVRAEFRAPVMLPATVTYVTEDAPAGATGDAGGDGDGTGALGLGAFGLRGDRDRLHLTGRVSPLPYR